MGKTKQLTKVIELAKLQVNIGKELHVNDVSIAIFLLSNGDVRAIGATCPHTNGPLAEGIVSGDYVYCPLQNWKVSLVTGEVQDPDEGEVETYETKVIDGFVHVAV